MNLKIDIPDQALQADLLHKINHKTKPIGALGLLENLAVQIGLIQQTLSPTLQNPSMLVFAGDHGIANDGVSAYPQAVTAQMVYNFLNGGAAINVFTQQNQLNFQLIDSGVNHAFEPHPKLINAKIALGTQSFLQQAAMTLAECEQAIAQGMRIMQTALQQQCNIVGFGEMGIGNTASASCLMSILCNHPIEHCVGRGTGLDDAGLAHKTKILSSAMALHKLNSQDDALKILATFGGFEIAMMVGAMLKAAEQKCVLLIDGFIASAALLVASKMAPNILHYCIFSHCSNESAHSSMLDFFKAKPLLNLGLRLGEGTGAALAYPLVLAAVNFLNNMASFESANISAKQ